ncbi:MAG TPA: hypothetical protein VG755_40435 [Nannocystaceae bacterium]|nr:hypothetical protein [Nannocystaceae bacterium]
MSKKHREFVKTHKAHNKKGGGCIVYCTSKYDPGDPHSHRYHAAEQARGENRVPYNDYEMVKPTRLYRSMKYLKELKKAGGVVGAVGSTSRKKVGVANVKPFYTSAHPFKHNAHHIIPSSNLEQSIDKVCENAKPNQERMRNIVIGGLLGEPYNNNDRPNMIVLPLLLEDSEVLGLPIHTDGQADHPDYRRSVETQLKARFQSGYTSLASQVAALKHDDDDPDPPPMKPTLEPLSKATYEAIIGMAVSKRAAKKSLDMIRAQLMRQVNKTLAG